MNFKLESNVKNKIHNLQNLAPMSMPPFHPLRVFAAPLWHLPQDVADVSQDIVVPESASQKEGGYVESFTLTKEDRTVFFNEFANQNAQEIEGKMDEDSEMEEEEELGNVVEEMEGGHEGKIEVENEMEGSNEGEIEVDDGGMDDLVTHTRRLVCGGQPVSNDPKYLALDAKGRAAWRRSAMRRLTAGVANNFGEAACRKRGATAPFPMSDVETANKNMFWGRIPCTILKAQIKLKYPELFVEATLENAVFLERLLS